jgi:predicted GIY-YIG superfamily endonuclease
MKKRKKRMTGFTKWLSKYYDEDTPIGDLARDALDDPRWPRQAKNPSYFLSFLFNVQACDAAKMVFREAWLLYKGISLDRVLENTDLLLRGKKIATTREIKVLKVDKRVEYIYAIHDEACTTFYIGRTAYLYKRFKQHTSSPQGKDMQKWITKLKSSGILRFSIVDMLLHQERVAIYERTYIQALQREGCVMLNKSYKVDSDSIWHQW